MAIDLWAARLDRPLTQREREQMLQLMPAERQKRLLKLQRTEKWQEPLCAYAMLRLAVWNQYGWAVMPEIAVMEQGKPWFPKYPKIHFSLSHTEGAVLVGLADRPIGVDIEKIRPVRERTMSQVVGTTSEEEFFRHWVRREARTKRSGSGIGTMLRSEPPMMPEEYYQEVALFSGYAAGVAVCGEEPEINVQKCLLEDLIAAAIN